MNDVQWRASLSAAVHVPKREPIAGAGHADVQLAPLDLSPLERALFEASSDGRQERPINPRQQYLLELEALGALVRSDFHQRGGRARVALELDGVEPDDAYWCGGISF